MTDKKGALLFLTFFVHAKRVSFLMRKKRSIEKSVSFFTLFFNTHPIETQKRINPKEMGKITVKFNRHSRDVPYPKKGTEGSAGYDLYAPRALSVPPQANEVVGLGFGIEIPENYAGLIINRSGLHAKERVWAVTGLIDPDYRGEIGVNMRNDSAKRYEIHEGDRIAQLLFIKKQDVEFVDGELSSTERGTGGFGSTGVSDTPAEQDQETKKEESQKDEEPLEQSQAV
jgi:dUTP pyrophosphatase